MKKRIARLALLVVLSLLFATVAAQPALAGNPFEGNPPGSQWGPHDINGKMYVVGPGPDDSLECLMVANDPWACGTLYLWWDAFEDVDGHAHVWGHFTLTNDDGTWVGEFEGIHSRTFDSEKPYQNMTYATATGTSGLYVGHTMTLTKHTEWGRSPIIVKGTID